MSADSDNPSFTPVRFGHINASYPHQFQTFSAERLFSPIGSNVVDVTFSIPGSPEVPALTNAEGLSFFGVIFEAPVVKRVRIAYGNQALGPNGIGDVDVAVMDDFIFGEPQPQD